MSLVSARLVFDADRNRSDKGRGADEGRLPGARLCISDGAGDVTIGVSRPRLDAQVRSFGMQTASRNRFAARRRAQRDAGKSGRKSGRSLAASFGG